MSAEKLEEVSRHGLVGRQELAAAIKLDLLVETDAALEKAEDAYLLSLEEGDIDGAILASHRIALMYFNQDALEDGVRVCIRALTWLPYCRDLGAEISFKAVYGGLLVAIGDLEAGFDMLVECQRLAQNCSDSLANWRALTSYAVALFDTDDFDRAALAARDARAYAQAQNLDESPQMISRSIAAWMGARAIGERKLEQKAIDEDFADAVEAELLGLLDEAKAKDLKYEIAECQCYLGIISWCRGENDVANCRFTSSIMMNDDIKNDILLYENTYWHAISLAEQARYEDAKTLLKAMESNPAIDLFPRKRSRHFKVASHIAQTSLDWRSALEHYKAYHLACIAEQNRLLTARTQTMKIALDLEALKHQLGHQLVEHERVLEENLRLAASHREADRASRTDPLTGLGNRRELEIQCTDWKAAGIKSVALLLIDADHFKTVNDRFGHAIGDAALLKLAELFSAAIPAGGLATRIGGEEFLLALPELPFPDAKEFAHTILQSVSSCPWQNIHGDLRLTCSIGLCIWNVDVPLESAIATADAYLYEAKRGGRNRCVHA